MSEQEMEAMKALDEAAEKLADTFRRSLIRKHTTITGRSSPTAVKRASSRLI